MYDKENDVERIFLEESRSKKRDGYGAMKRKATRGSSRKALKFPSDFLTAKQKREMNGEIIVSSMYKDINKIPSWEEIKEMDSEKATNILKTTKSLHSGTKLQAYWGIRPATHYALLEKLGLHTPKPKPINKPKRGSSVYKTLDEVVSYDQFLDMDLGKRIEILTVLKNEFSLSAIKRHWGISQGTLYTHLYRYGILEYKGDDEKVKKSIAKNSVNLSEIKVEETPVKEIIEEVKEVEEIPVEEVIAEVGPTVMVEEESNTVDISYNEEKVDETIVAADNNGIVIPTEKVIENEYFDLTIKSTDVSRVELENKIFRTLLSLDSNDKYDFELKVRKK